ncbi:hypothetical protein BH683_007790 [Williamsia sp. 1138]|uniref:hypothetical protein n=1 Tax=Williamsia sp. 1138 TaxID=1903117 RepID=UPI000A10737D|nr:hypothetical protein [Williamsia sp. 1138]OZG29819.1 hypothetical protein BH683_007790 [Williamsia sp. 1138]
MSVPGIYSGTPAQQAAQRARLHLAALDAGIAIATAWTRADGSRPMTRTEYAAALTDALHS